MHTLPDIDPDDNVIFDSKYRIKKQYNPDSIFHAQDHLLLFNYGNQVAIASYGTPKYVIDAVNIWARDDFAELSLQDYLTKLFGNKL